MLDQLRPYGESVSAFADCHFRLSLGADCDPTTLWTQACWRTPRFLLRRIPARPDLYSAIQIPLPPHQCRRSMCVDCKLGTFLRTRIVLVYGYRCLPAPI